MMPHGGDTRSKPATTTTTTTTKDHENQSSDGRKITTTKPPEQGLKCPRCDSPNTKFCYYNNYSLTQPRHFCKTCRRYWTKGGALRNVPIGGGCRKNKKGIKPSSSSSSSLSSRSLSCDSGGSSSDQLSSFKFLHGLSTPLDFHLGGLTFPSSSRLQQQQHHLPIATGFYNNQFSPSFGDLSASSSATSTVSGFQLLDPSSARGSSSLIGLNYPFSSSTGNGLFSGGGAIQGVNMNVNSLNAQSSLASSIESLSSLNQDLHWKLQQQRLAMLFGGENQKDDNNNNNSVSFSPVVNLENQTTLQRPQPILFQNLEISKPSAAESGFPVGDSSSSRKEGTNGGDTDTAPTEWFFGNSYVSLAPTPTSTSSGGGGNNGHDNNASNNWGGGSGVHAWGDVQQQPYSALP